MGHSYYFGDFSPARIMKRACTYTVVLSGVCAWWRRCGTGRAQFAGFANCAALAENREAPRISLLLSLNQSPAIDPSEAFTFSGAGISLATQPLLPLLKSCTTPDSGASTTSLAS